jgi:hypothetical protein
MTKAPTKATDYSVVAWVAGPVALAGFWALLKYTAGPSHSKWAPVYLAGAAGALCYELMRNRWRIEMPSANNPVGKRAEPSFGPFGPLADLGFFGRMITGAVAAPAFIALVDALSATSAQSANLTKYLTAVAGRPDTIAWGIAVGFAAPAVWSMMEGFVKARGAAADTQLELEQKRLDLLDAKMNKVITEVVAANGSHAGGNGSAQKAGLVAQLVEMRGVMQGGRGRPTDHE